MSEKSFKTELRFAQLACSFLYKMLIYFFLVLLICLHLVANFILLYCLFMAYQFNIHAQIFHLQNVACRKHAVTKVCAFYTAILTRPRAIFTKP